MDSHSRATAIATDRSRVVRHSVLWLVAAAFVMLAAAPADAGNKHKHKKHHHHDHYSHYDDHDHDYDYHYDDDVVVIVRPRHVYAPPPVVHYHRAPVVYAPPSFNLVFPIDLD